MKAVYLILSILSCVMLASDLICGFWIAKAPEVDPSSVKFHMVFSLLTVLIVVGTIIAGYFKG